MWNILRVKSGTDGKVVNELAAMDIRAVSPVAHRYVVHRRTKAKLKKEFLMFPGYIFVERGAYINRAAVPNALGFLGFRSDFSGDLIPHAVSDEQVEAFSSFRLPELKKTDYWVGKLVEISVLGLTKAMAVVSEVKESSVVFDIPTAGKPIRYEIAA